ncbi:MAG: S1-like domain-containing RNA-binding protein [Arcobacteraceae bacterium]|jgi:predicted RNA-binding protein (virulence factor B family)|nr:S1-like domain-containing RNA-binding protein [Arcobacteraceae bacterium]
MNETIKIGYINKLLINRQTDNGFYLCSKDLQEVLLPNSYITNNMKIGDVLDVFVYTDSQDRAVAVTSLPKAKVGEFAYFEVVDLSSFGAFVDWGLPKDLFVPKSKQKIAFKKGMKTVLRVSLDEKTNRIFGDHKFAKYLSSNTKNLCKNQEVELLVYKKGDLGYSAIVNNLYDSLLFYSDVFEEIKIGDKKRGFIKNIRSDGKIDLSLRLTGSSNLQNDTQKILDILKQNNNHINLTYKSSSQEIQDMFGLSKKAYKKALTTLIDNKEIELSEDCIKKVEL